MPTLSKDQIVEIELEIADLLEQLELAQQEITSLRAEVLRLRERDKRD